MSNRAPIRRLLLAAGIGLTLIGGAGLAGAEADDDEVPMPGLVTAVASCEHGTAAITVWVDDNRDAPLPVRLDRTRPDEASLTKNTVLDEDRGMHKVIFEPVPAGEYNVHVERAGKIPADDVPAVVKPCGDLLPTDELLRIEVACQAGWGLATFVVANPRTQGVVEYNLTNTNFGAHEIQLSQGLFLRITENEFDDGTYKAHLTGDGVDVTKEFTVACKEGNVPKLEVAAACAGSTGTVTVNLVNPNRVPVGYDVSLNDLTKKLTLKGGEKGSVTFPGIATGDHPVIVKGSDETQAAGVAKVDCGTETSTTTTTTTTETPVPQGRSDSELANTGASVGGLVGLAALVLGLGGALLMIGRRRARGN